MGAIMRIIRGVDTACALVAEALVFTMMLLVAAEVAARYVFSSPIPGEVEFATLSLVLVLYLALPYTQLKQGHVRVELFVAKIAGPARHLLEAFILFLCLIPTILMFWATAQEATISVTGREFVTGIINFPVWPGRCAVPFGLGLLALTIVNQICGRLVAVFAATGQAGAEK